MPAVFQLRYMWLFSEDRLSGCIAVSVYTDAARLCVGYADHMHGGQQFADCFKLSVRGISIVGM